MIHTTHGSMDERDLQRTLGFEDRPSEFVIWVEWRIADHGLCEVCAQPDMPQPVNGAVLVRRDAHCILKEPSVIATAIASAM